MKQSRAFTLLLIGGAVAASLSSVVASKQLPYSHWDCTSPESWCTVGLEMRVLPHGSYLRGSSEIEIAEIAKTYGHNLAEEEGPQRRVTISHAVAVAKYEATFELWDLCHSDGLCRRKPDTHWGRGRQPVHSISWNEITKEFLPWLNLRLGISTDSPHRYRLPSEAEWEYATRAGTSGDYSFAGQISTDKANYGPQDPNAPLRRRPVVVDDGSFPLNPWGLAHVHGNMFE